MYIVLSDREFDPRANYQKPIEDRVETEQWHNNLWYNIDNFDHHGFDLCRLERLYAKKNMFAVSGLRARHWVLQKDWFLEEGQLSSSKKGNQTGVHINNALLLQRPAFEDSALEQIQRFSKKCNLVNKLVAMKPKWGLKFEIDYCDEQGNSFQLLKFDFDSNSYTEIVEKKKITDEWLLSVDWADSGHKILDQKSEWINLTSSQQSVWKQNFFGIK